MKILRVIESMNPSYGGPCQGIRNITPSLNARGFSTEILSLDSPDSAFLEKESLTIHAVGPGKGPWKFSKSLINWLVENYPRFDIIIVHGLWIYTSYATQKAFDTLKRRADNAHSFIPSFYVMPHGMLDPYFQRDPSRRLKAIRNWFYWKFIEHKVISEAAGVLFTCEMELILARQTFSPYKPRKEMNIGYGIKAPDILTGRMTAEFKSAFPAIKKPYFLFLSRINEKKGLDLLVEAYAALLLEMPEQASIVPDLVIAGPGLDTAFGEGIRQEVEKTKVIKSKVFFTGMLTGNLKWAALYSCEAFILPSHQENFGIAVVEALSCGIPVLISDQVNIWKEIIDGGAGFAEKDSKEGTLNLLKHWMQLASSEKNQMSQNASSVYKNKFNIESATEKFIAVMSGNK